MKMYAFVALLFGMALNLFGFDFASYKPVKMAELTDELSKAYRSGVSYYPALKIHINAVSVAEPYVCSDSEIQTAFARLSMTDIAKRVPTHHCIKFKEKDSDAIYEAHIQDVLVDDFVNEVKNGQGVQFFASILAYVYANKASEDRAVILVNEFRAVEPDIKSATPAAFNFEN